ncbi:MAG: phosphoglycerate kinase [Patescibacteria group bacterium]
MQSVQDVDVSGKTVLVRCDFDVPLQQLDNDGSRLVVEDSYRIEACLPTLKYLVDKSACVVACGHLDRPGGKVKEGLRLDPIARKLSEYLEFVHKVDSVTGADTEEVVAELEAGDILVLENLRFDSREKENDKAFAQELASLADVYVNESFATSHRKHASLVGVTEFLPSYGGLRLETEIKKLSLLKENPLRPLIFILGGAKVATKAPLVEEFSTYADKILLGGKLMFEQSLEDLPGVVFPIDAESTFDIGKETVDLFKNHLSNAGTVVWNGPLGKFEEPEYSRGTRLIADYLVRSSADVIVGGGDTLAALKQVGLREQMDFVSTGGGAMLSYLSGKHLPALDVLT